jgi:EAL domain-containing protein (putative c-di-GMP-specific phosphodiesterase class I)
LAVSGLPGERLCLEITESQLLIIDDAAVDDLRDLTARGVRLAIDDFGTGRTGFDYLRRLPVTELKIDKSFVGGLVVDPTHTAITASMVALGLGLGLEVVAEGIETREQLQALRTMGCTTGQGWYWYPALPADDLDTVLDDILDAGSGPRAVRERAAHRSGVKTHRRSTLYRE